MKKAFVILFFLTIELARWIRCVLCKTVGHKYRVLRRMNTGARKVGCDRCGAVWGMHDATQSFVPWDDELEEMYAPGGLLDPNHYSLAEKEVLKK